MYRKLYNTVFFCCAVIMATGLQAEDKLILPTLDPVPTEIIPNNSKPGGYSLGPAMPRAFHYGGRHAVRDLNRLLHVTWEDPTYWFHYYSHSLDELGFSWTEPINPMASVGFTVDRALMAKMAIDPVTGYLYMLLFYRVNPGEEYKTGLTRSTDNGESWSQYIDLGTKLGTPDVPLAWGTFTIGNDQTIHICVTRDSSTILYTRANLSNISDLEDLTFTRADGITAGADSFGVASGTIFQGTIVLDRNNDPHIIFSGDGRTDTFGDKTPYHIYYKSDASIWGPNPPLQLMSELEHSWGIPEMVFDINNRGYYFLDLDPGGFLFGTWEPPVSAADSNDFGTLNNTGLVDGMDGAVKLINQNFPSLEIYDTDNLYLPQADVDDTNNIIYLVGNTDSYSDGQGSDIVVLALENATSYAGQNPIDMPWTVFRLLTSDGSGNVGADMIYNPASSHIDVFWSAAGDTSNNAWYKDASIPPPDYDASPAFILVTTGDGDPVINENDLITFYGAVQNFGTQILGPVPVTISVIDTNEQEIFTNSTTAPPTIPGAITDTVELGTWMVSSTDQEFTVTLTTNYSEDEAPYNDQISTHFFAFSAVTDGWPVESDSMNLAILVVDYETYEFEGGNFSVHLPCPECTTDTLPFIIRETEPADFGDIAFVYNLTGDTLFWGTIVWMGTGQILYPEVVLPPDSFNTVTDTIAEPVAIEYFNQMGIDPDTFSLKADSAWRTVKSLDITENFARNEYYLGAYLYPPGVGAFDPGPAKWIIFLYQDLTRDFVSTDQDGIFPEKFILYQNYPNPFNANTTIRYELPELTFVKLIIYDLLGNRVSTLVDEIKPPGFHEVQWDVSYVSSGIYFYRFEVGRKMLVIK